MTEPIKQLFERHYADTHRRLRTDPEYIALTMAANDEEARDPDLWIMRNRLALYVEQHMQPA